jgi:hypothetical protein
MAIVRVEVGLHSQQNVIHPFSGLGLPDEQPITDAAYSLHRLPWLHFFKKLKSSAMFAHDGSFPQAGTDCYRWKFKLRQYRSRIRTSGVPLLPLRSG